MANLTLPPEFSCRCQWLLSSAITPAIFEMFPLYPHGSTILGEMLYTPVNVRHDAVVNNKLPRHYVCRSLCSEIPTSSQLQDTVILFTSDVCSSFMPTVHQSRNFARSAPILLPHPVNLI